METNTPLAAIVAAIQRVKEQTGCTDRIIVETLIVNHYANGTRFTLEEIAEPDDTLWRVHFPDLGGCSRYFIRVGDELPEPDKLARFVSWVSGFAFNTYIPAAWGDTPRHVAKFERLIKEYVESR